MELGTAALAIPFGLLGFAPSSALAALAGAQASAAVSPRALVLAFIPVMGVAAVATWHRAATEHDEGRTECPPVDLLRTAPAGAGVGLLTGFFGVGGGFVIVPVLTLWFGVCFRRAIATSLVIITITGAAGLIGHLVADAALGVPVTAALAGATAVGAVTGTQVGQRLPQALLGRAFAVVVALIALFLLVDVLLLGGPPQA
ncbi:MAG: sulfite exporter TauE/SafE family protein [Solirubrobacterales bacterium]|nr:sulfite exporter TauE/SafE family protein [Solirubrobacterales bacterium]